MSRDPSGIYTYPDGTRGVPDTTIFSARYNTFLDDLASTLNTKLPVNMGGTNADDVVEARTNLKAEASTVQVTNYDTHVFEAGSFYSLVGATGAPNSTNVFCGIAYVGTDPGQVVNIEARMLADPVVPARKYFRQKFNGVWGAWSLDASGSFVAKAGDTMTGSLDIQGPAATLTLNAISPNNTADIFLNREGLAVWLLRSDGPSKDFHFYRFDDAGVANDAPFIISHADGQIALSQAPTKAASATRKDYVDAGDAAASASANTRVLRSGDAMTGYLNISLANGSGMATASGSLGILGVDNAGNGSAILQFHRVGQFASYFGIDTDNVWKVGGWSMGPFAYRVVHEGLGNPTLVGTVTAGAFSAPNIYATNFWGNLQGNISGNANYANSAGSAGGLSGNPNISVSWIEGPEGLDMKTAGSGADYDCRFWLQWPNLNVYGAGGFDTFNFNTRLKASSHFTAEQGFMARGGVDIGGLNNWQINWEPGLVAYMGNARLGNFQFVSDYRMKKDVAPLMSMWDTVKLLNPISYKRKDFNPSTVSGRAPLFPADDTERWGFIAHELQETLIQSAASDVKDAPNAVQSPDPWPVLAALTKALQEALARIEALEAAA